MFRDAMSKVVPCVLIILIYPVSVVRGPFERLVVYLTDCLSKLSLLPSRD